MHLIIADHTLKDFQGHSYEYCRAIREVAVAKGWKVTTLGTSYLTSQIQSDLNAEAFFKHICFHQKSQKLWNPAGIITNTANPYITTFADSFRTAIHPSPFSFFFPLSVSMTSSALHDLPKNYPRLLILKLHWYNISHPGQIWKKTISPTNFTNTP
jgi:hypothetical protein